jgi:hypothetical protein
VACQIAGVTVTRKTFLPSWFQWISPIKFELKSKYKQNSVIQARLS